MGALLSKCLDKDVPPSGTVEGIRSEDGRRESSGSAKSDVEVHVLSSGSTEYGGTSDKYADEDRFCPESSNIDVTEWYQQLSKSHRYKLLLCMMGLDRDMSIKPSSRKANELQQKITDIMQQVLRRVAEYDPLFQGKLVPSGSFYEGTKVNQPNEFDFALIIRPKDYFIRVNHTNVAKHSVTCDCVVSAAGCSPAVECDEIDAKTMKTRFQSLLDQAMISVGLPRDIEHGGHDRPNYSGYRRNGPAFLFQFVYKGDLVVTVDLTLAVPVSITETRLISLMTELLSRDFLTQFLCKENLCQEVLLLPTVSGVWLCSNSFAEHSWFNQQSIDSVPKVVLRICKILAAKYTNVEKKDASLSYHMQVDVEKTREYFRNTHRRLSELQFTTYDDPYTGRVQYDLGSGPESRMFSHLRCDHLRWLQLVDAESITQLNENVGTLSFFQSYVFKKLILTMMAAESTTDGHSAWQNKQDIPALVLRVMGTVRSLLNETCSECTASGPKILSTVWEVEEALGDCQQYDEAKDHITNGRTTPEPESTNSCVTETGSTNSHDISVKSESDSAISLVTDDEASGNDARNYVDGIQEGQHVDDKLSIDDDSENPINFHMISGNSHVGKLDLFRLRHSTLMNNHVTLLPHIHYRDKIYPCPCAAFLRIHRYGRECLIREINNILDVVRRMVENDIKD